MQSQRLIACLQLLQGKPRTTARELARQLEVSTRTVYRDVEALCEAGVPIYMERGPLGGIVLADDYRRALAQFTTDEVQSLFASGQGPMSDLGIASQAQALQKLAGALPAMQRRAAETSRDRLFVDHNKWSRGQQPTDVLQRLRAASERDGCVRLHYRDRSGTLTQRRVDPLGLVAKAGVWYLVAREDKGYRTFRAERIVAVDALPDTFARPADFNLESHWNESVISIERQSQEYYNVVLRVDQNAIVKYNAFWNAEIVDEDETTSTLRVAFPSRDVAIAHILVHSDTADIITPTDLAAEIVNRAHRAIDKYAVPTRRTAERGHR